MSLDAPALCLAAVLTPGFGTALFTPFAFAGGLPTLATDLAEAVEGPASSVTWIVCSQTTHDKETMRCDVHPARHLRQLLALQLYGRQGEDPYAYIYVKTLLAARKADYVPKGWKTLSLPTHSAVATVTAARTSGKEVREQIRSSRKSVTYWKI